MNTATSPALLLAILSEPAASWHREALCAQVDPELFFPEKGGSSRTAKKICARCPVREQCLQEALEHDERHGVWGGVSVGDRRAIKRGAQAA